MAEACRPARNVHKPPSELAGLEQDNARVINDKITGQSRGFAFVSFDSLGGVSTATECMEKIQARLLLLDTSSPAFC